MSDSGVLCRIFKSASSAKLMDFFMDHDNFDYSIGEVAQATGLSTQTVSKEVMRLACMGLITKRRVVGNMPMYCLNAENRPIKLLSEFALQISLTAPLATSGGTSSEQCIIEVETGKTGAHS